MDITITHVIHEYQLKFNDMPGTLETVFGWAKENLPGEVVSIEPIVRLRRDGSGFHHGWVVRCEVPADRILDHS